MKVPFEAPGTVTGFQSEAVCQVPLMPFAHVTVVSICRMPARLVTAPVRSAAWPGPVDGNVGPADCKAQPVATTMYQVFALFLVQMTPFTSRASVAPEPLAY